MYIFFIVFPSIIEIIVVTQLPVEQKQYVLLICGSILILGAMYGGIKLGMDIKTDQIGEDATWCGKPSKYNSLFTSGYMVYTLPQWTLANMIMPWAIADKITTLPFYVHLMVYMPLMIYLTILVIGCAIPEIKTETNYQEV